MSRNVGNRDPAKEHSETDKKKAREATQVQPENCRVPTGGSCPIMPDRFEELMEIAAKYYKVVDYKTLFNTEPIHFAPDPVDPNIDHAALDGEPAKTKVPAPIDPQKQAAILKRELEWAEAAKKEDEKSEEEKKKEEKELEEMRIEFQKACDAFYGKK